MIKLEDYPKSKEIFSKYVKKWLIEFQKELLKGVEGEAPPITDSIVEAASLNIIQQNPRSLYNFFDNEGIILLLDGPDEMYGWTWQIRNNRNVINSVGAGTLKREEAELEGFKECFKLMESL